MGGKKTAAAILSHLPSDYYTCRLAVHSPLEGTPINLEKKVAWTMRFYFLYATEADQVWGSKDLIGSRGNNSGIADNVTLSGPAFPRIGQELRIVLFMILACRFPYACGDSRVGLF